MLENIKKGFKDFMKNNNLLSKVAFVLSIVAITVSIFNFNLNGKRRWEDRHIGKRGIETRLEGGPQNRFKEPNGDNWDNRYNRNNRDIRDNIGSRDNRGIRNNIGSRDSRDNWDNRDNQYNKDYRYNRENGPRVREEIQAPEAVDKNKK